MRRSSASSGLVTAGTAPRMPLHSHGDQRQVAGARPITKCRWNAKRPHRRSIETRSGVERFLEALARAEHGNLASGNADLLPVLRIVAGELAALRNGERTEVGDGDLLSVRKCVLDRRHHDVDVAGGPYLRNVGLRGEGFGEIGLVHAASLGPRPVRPREDVVFRIHNSRNYWRGMAS